MTKSEKFLRSMDPGHRESSGQPAGKKPWYRPTRSGIAGTAICLVLTAGCQGEVTFPSATIPQSIESICRESYHLDVTARVADKTIGVMMYTEDLLDETGAGLSPRVHEIIGNLTQTVQRVALSTDHQVDFAVIALRGRKNQMELRIIRNVIDMKKAQTEALSVTEAMNRTLFQQKRYDETKQEEQEGVFDLQDITLQRFLADQIVQRMRFRKPPEENRDNATGTMFPEELFESKLSDRDNIRTFMFSILSFSRTGQDEAVQSIYDLFITANEVFSGYKYTDFDRMVIRDIFSNLRLEIDRPTIDLFQQKQIGEQDIRALIRDASSYQRPGAGNVKSGGNNRVNFDPDGSGNRIILYDDFTPDDTE